MSKALPIGYLLKNGQLFTLCLILTCSCSTINKKSDAKDPNDSTFAPKQPLDNEYNSRIEDLETPESEAVVEAFKKTINVENIRENFEAVIFEGVSETVRSNVVRRFGSQLPLTKANDGWSDVNKWKGQNTGKPIMKVFVEAVSINSNRSVFRVTTRFGDTGGNVCRVSLKKTQGDWVVDSMDIMIAD